MALHLAYSASALVVTAIVAFLLTCSAVYQRLRPGLRSIPGPWIASFTDLWRLLVVRHGRFEVACQKLHDKHGDLVRIGPNCISVADPREIRQIYGITRLFQKVSHNILLFVRAAR